MPEASYEGAHQLPVGRLVGDNFGGEVIASYSIGSVANDFGGARGLVGGNFAGQGNATGSYWYTQTSGHSESAVGGHVHAVPVSLAAYDDLIKGQDRNVVGQRRLRGKSEHLSVAIRIAIGSPDYALSPLLPPRLCHAVSDTRLGEDVGWALRVVSQLVAEIRHVGAQEL